MTRPVLPWLVLACLAVISAGPLAAAKPSLPTLRPGPAPAAKPVASAKPAAPAAKPAARPTMTVDGAQMARPPRIDGDLGEWAGVPYLALLGGGRWRPAQPGATYGGNTDLAARIYAGWDAGNLYLALEVYDNTLVPAADPAKPWEGDCVIVGLDPFKDAGDGYQPDDSEFVLAWSPGGAVLLRTAPPARAGAVAPAKVAVGKHYRPPQPADTTPQPRVKMTYEAAIPWSELKSGGKPGVTTGLALAICDNDGAGRKGWLAAGGGLIGGKQPAEFARLALQRGSAAPPAAVVAAKPATPATPPAATAASQPGASATDQPNPQEPAGPPPVAPNTPAQPERTTATVPPPPPPPPAGLPPRFAAPDLIRFDGDCFTIRGQDTLVLSGSLHYFRVSPAEWPDRLAKLRAAGCNAVETPIPWNWHEPREGNTDLSQLDAFLAAAESAGLYVIARVGPYVGVEWDGGGYPAWLAVKGVAYRSATADYAEWAGRWLGQVLPVLQKHDLPGGRLLLVVLEDSPATAALAAQARAAGLQAPLAAVNSPAAKGGDTQAAADLIDALSLFPRWDAAAAAKAMAARRQEEPGAPLTLAELGVGWFSAVGGLPSPDQPGAEPEQAELALKLALEQGAGLINLYLAAGGSNPGYWAADWVTTTYDYAGPVGEGGLLGEKFYRLRPATLFARAFAPDLLRARPAPAGAASADIPGVTVTERINGNTAFLFLRPAEPGGDTAFHLKLTYLDPSTGQPVVVPQTGKIVLGGREEKVLLANLALPGVVLRYATSDVAAITTVADRTVVVLYGDSGTPGEVAVRCTGRPLVAGDPLAQAWDDETRTLTVNYMFGEDDQSLLVDNLQLLLVNRRRAGRLWLAGGVCPTITSGYQVAASQLDRQGLHLTLDTTEGSTAVRVLTPAAPESVTVDGEDVPFTYDATTRTAAFQVETPDFFHDRPKPKLVKRILNVMSEDPGLEQTFTAARGQAEPLGGGSGWLKCDFSPLAALGIVANGHACYHLEIEPAGFNYLSIETYAADPKLVFLNGKLIPELSNNRTVTEADISGRAKLGANSLDIVYVNQGRANAGPRMAEEKGVRLVELLNVTGPAAGGRSLTTWRVRRAAGLTAEPAEAAPAFDDQGWETVEVGAGPQALFDGYQGLAWYRANVSLAAAELADKLALLSFGGVDDAAWVYVNGHRAGEHVGADKPFRLDITPFLRAGENTLAVAVENRSGPGGIFQPVALALVERAGQAVKEGLVREGLLGEQAGYTEAAFDDDRWFVLQLGDWQQARQLRDHDGIVWYRFPFRLPGRDGWQAPWFFHLKAMGDATLYLNGKPLGKYAQVGPQADFYLPAGWLLPDKTNVVAVAVRGAGGPAGITEAALKADPAHVVKRRTVLITGPGLRAK